MPTAELTERAEPDVEAVAQPKKEAAEPTVRDEPDVEGVAQPKKKVVRRRKRARGGRNLH